MLSADGPPVILESPGFPIGLAEEAYCERCVHLAAGDRLYLYSDGLTDGMNPGGERVGDARLLDAICRGVAEPLPDEVNALLGERFAQDFAVFVGYFHARDLVDLHHFGHRLRVARRFDL